MSHGARISLIVILLGVGLAGGWWWAGDWGPGETRSQIPPADPVAQESLGRVESPVILPESESDPVAVAETGKERRRLARLRRKEERANSPALQEGVRGRRSGLGGEGPSQLWDWEFDRDALMDLGYDSAEIDRLQQRFEDARDLILPLGLMGPGGEPLSPREAVEVSRADKLRLIDELGDDAAAVLWAAGENNAVILYRPKEAARKLGLRKGDQLKEYNGEPIYSSAQYLEKMKMDKAANESATLTFGRISPAGRHRDFSLTLRHGMFGASFGEESIPPKFSP